MSPAPETRRARALHLDIDSFSFEGFSNGATIQYREMLRRFSSAGIDSAVVTIGQACSSRWVPAESATSATSLDRRWHIDQGVAVGEYLLDRDPASDLDLYRRAIETALVEIRPDLVIVNTPPDRLEDAELALFEVLAGIPAERICFVPDDLFPRPDAVGVDRFARLSAALRVFTLVAPSRFIARRVEAALGPCRVFANVFEAAAVRAPDAPADLVTFINPHPMKGVEIFLEIARHLPDRHFQVIRAWPYPPVFSCDLPNVTVRSYTPEMVDVWDRTAVLIVPSLCAEGFGRIVVEAQLNGIPVIAHAIGGLPEASGEGAILVPAPRLSGGSVEPEITPQDKERSVAAFCAHIERVFAGDYDDGLLSAQARANAQAWVARGELDVAELAAPYAVRGAAPPSLLVLAPHADDAAFSVGGLLRAWRGPKTVLTIFGRSNFTLAEGFGKDTAAISETRRREDAAFCERVGARLVTWDLPEAALRRGPNWESIFDADPSRHLNADKLVQEALDTDFADVLADLPHLLIAPLGLGGHGDHVLVRETVRALASAAIPARAYYEDLPYAATITEDEIATIAAELIPDPALTFVPISSMAAAKVDDARSYDSQIADTILYDLRRYAERWPEPSERLWSGDLIAPIIARGLGSRA